MSEYVWVDGDGLCYQKWEDMDLEHHKNVITFLRRKVASLQEQIEGLDPRDPEIEMWVIREALEDAQKLLEGASCALGQRLEGTEWELDTPLTPVVKRKQKQGTSTMTGEVLRKVRLDSG